MGNTSNKSKQEWNASHYTQLKISINPSVASAFKQACTADNVSMASKLSQFIVDYCRLESKPKATDEFTTRPKRRIAVGNLIRHLEQIKDAEEHYRDNIPVNLQGSVVYEKADLSVSVLEEAIELLASAY